MIGSAPNASHSGGERPSASAKPGWPPRRRFLKNVSHAAANVHDGSMYGTTSAGASQRRPGRSVRTTSHASEPPSASARIATATEMETVFVSGSQNMRWLIVGVTNVRSR